MNVLGLEDNDCFSLNITNLGRYGHLTGRSRFFNLPVGENAFEHGDNKRECSRDNDRNNKPACRQHEREREGICTTRFSSRSPTNRLLPRKKNLVFTYLIIRF